MEFWRNFDFVKSRQLKSKLYFDIKIKIDILENQNMEIFDEMRIKFC
jgi:hypothetical protein